MMAVIGKVALAEGNALLSQPPDSTGDMPGLKVLLAEDFVDNRRMMEFYFKSTPHRVETAANGQLAVEMFQRGSYDLVLMDIQMPELNGFEATRRIRQKLAGKPLPIVALTANAMPEDRQASKEAGMDDFLTKPAPVSYTHLRAHETPEQLVCRLLLEKQKTSP
mgnify:CR=1 FL=1